MRRILIGSVALSALCGVLALVPVTFAQRDVGLLDPGEAQAQLERATREGQRAEARAARLGREAEAVTEVADKTAREIAALAARIQGAEADIAVARARYSLAQTDRAALSERLAVRQQPLVRLTGALQTTARRPLALSALQPGSLKDLVYVRAVLNSAVPEIRRRTSALRSELEEGRRLERQAGSALEELRSSEQDLRSRREELAALETQQRIASRDARAVASREAERALALAEDARDLNGLIEQIDAAGALRRELAALPGPVPRPRGLAASDSAGASTPGASEPEPPDSVEPALVAENSPPPAGYQLPVQGRTVTGFGEMRESGLRSTGLAIVPAPDAQVVAPASGRIAFAGPYRGYDRIVILEHAGGWTSLITGLARVDVQVGEQVIGGSPLGVAARQEPSVTLELRRGGNPINPLQFMG